MVIHLGFEPLIQRPNALELEAVDTPITFVLVVMWCVGMIGEGIVSDDRIPLAFAVLVAVFHTVWIPVRFGDASLGIETSDAEALTLIVYVYRTDAYFLADRNDPFLRELGARTERERHSDTDVRVLVIVD